MSFFQPQILKITTPNTKVGLLTYTPLARQRLNYPIFSPVKTHFFSVFLSRAFNPKIKGFNVLFVVTIFLFL